MLCYLGLLVSSYFTPPHPAPTLSPVHGRACHWGCLCCKALNCVTSLPGPSVHYSEYPMVLAIVRAFSGYKAPVFHWEGYWASFLCLDSQRNSPISVFCYPSFFFFLLTFIILRFTGGWLKSGLPVQTVALLSGLPLSLFTLQLSGGHTALERICWSDASKKLWQSLLQRPVQLPLGDETERRPSRKSKHFWSHFSPKKVYKIKWNKIRFTLTKH